MLPHILDVIHCSLNPDSVLSIDDASLKKSYHETTLVIFFYTSSLIPIIFVDATDFNNTRTVSSK